MEFEFVAKLWIWGSEKGSWHFATLPEEVSNQIYFENSLKSIGLKRGFGAVKVEVEIKNNVFSTSIFPSSKDKSYLLPIKASVRKAANIAAGDEVEMKIRLI